MSGEQARTLKKVWTESAGAVSRVVAFLRRCRLPGMLDLSSPPDADSLFVSLEVEKRAYRDGGNNLPSSSEEVISGSQRDIVDYHRKLQDKARTKVQRMAAKLLAEARRIQPSEVTDRLSDLPSKCQNKIDRVLAEFDSKLKLLHAQENYEQQYLIQNDAQSEEDESDGPATKAIYFLIMLAVASMTTLALGSDILWGVDAGSLLNFEAAIVVAIITVTVPFLTAVVVSKPVSAKLNRQRPEFRLAMLLTTIFLGLLACFCAHLIIVSADASVTSDVRISAAVKSITTDPGAFRGDLNALIGIGFVFVMGILGFVLGNLSINTDSDTNDVRAPHLSTSRVREKLARQMRKQVNGIVDAAERDVDRAANRLQKKFKKFSRHVEQAIAIQANYDDYLAGLEESCNLLLERYRHANAAKRNTIIPPSFSEKFCFRLEGASRRAFFEDGIERYRESDDEMKDFSDTVAKVRRDLRTLNRDAIQSLGTVEAHEQADETYAYT